MRSGCGMIERRIDWEAQANNGKEMVEVWGGGIGCSHVFS
jgi:hypothetical protein